jgi:adenosine deaminase
MSARPAPVPPASTPISRPTLWTLPKVDLHRHLEGSLRLETMAEIANEHGVDLPSHSIEELRRYVQVVDEEPPDYIGFLSKFHLIRRFYRTPEAIARIAYEAVADAAADNIKYLELRFNPEALAQTRNFTFEEVTDWVIQGVNAAQAERDITVRLIMSIQRYVDVAMAWHIARIAMARIDRGVVGLDLLGNERGFPARPYAPVFRAAKAAGLGVTIHAGEGAGPESVRQAVELLGADRLGHGIRTIEDSEVAQLVRERNVTLEVCVTSNLQTAVVPSLWQHPLPDLVALQLRVTLNTDDPSISDTTLTDEYLVATGPLRVAPGNLGGMILNGIHAAFLPAAEKTALEERFKRELHAAGFLA